MRALITGGSGLLGGELKKLYKNAYFPTHEEFDITDPPKKTEDFSLVIHAAADTDIPRAEIDKIGCLEVNTLATYNLVRLFEDVPFVYISSEYAYNPVNFYAFSKRAGELAVSLHPKHLIIRTLFKPNPFPFKRAFVDQYTNGDYVDVIAPLIKEAIDGWSLDPGLVYVGTGRKTIYELAKRTVPNIGKIYTTEIKDCVIPRDYI